MSSELFIFEENPNENNKEKKEEIKPETDILVRQTFIISEDTKKALKIKAITEGIPLNKMVRNILEKNIESHYYNNL